MRNLGRIGTNMVTMQTDTRCTCTTLDACDTCVAASVYDGAMSRGCVQRAQVSRFKQADYNRLRSFLLTVWVRDAPRVSVVRI